MGGRGHPDQAGLAVVAADILAVDDQRRAFIRREGEHSVGMPEIRLLPVAKRGQPEIDGRVLPRHGFEPAHDLQ